MLLVRTYVAASAIEGVGVFAAEDIPAGTAIWRLEPGFDHVLDHDAYEAASPVLRELLERYGYPSPDRPGCIVYEVDNGRFMNHADNPNTDFSVPTGGFTRRDVTKGEELTCDYGEFYGDFELLPAAAAKAP